MGDQPFEGGDLLRKALFQDRVGVDEVVRGLCGGDGSGEDPTMGPDMVGEMGEAQSSARTTRGYAVRLLRR